MKRKTFEELAERVESLSQFLGKDFWIMRAYGKVQLQQREQAGSRSITPFLTNWELGLYLDGMSLGADLARRKDR